ncbi:hypothetical protein T492DRAFT_870894 [Pavlovales sp. CCMP2436]|nr:hypothetical protein T492DRAFT_870894 [Pavlovales sp. CCMP2436]
MARQSLILLANTCEDRIEGAGLSVRVPQRALGVFQRHAVATNFYCPRSV